MTRPPLAGERRRESRAALRGGGRTQWATAEELQSQREALAPDAMDVNEDGVIMNDADDEELVRDAGLAALSHRAARVPLARAPLLLRKLLLPQPPPLG